MGELLRAVLDATCIDSMATFYSANLSLTLPNTGAATFADRSIPFQCKQDVWFLMTGYGLYENFTTTAPFIGFPNSSVSTIRLASGRTGRKYSDQGIVKSNANGNYQNWRTLPEYVLWEPADTILITENIQVTSAVAGSILNKSLVMTGIEYRMPEGKGYANGGGF